MKKVYDQFDEVFIEIYNNNYSYVYKYLIILVHDHDIAQDLSHDIFLRIYKSRNSELTGGNIRNYLKKSAQNIAIDHLRQMAREEARSKKLIPEIKEYDDTFYLNLENSIIEGEVISTVNDVLEDFSEKSRKIFIARIFENKTRKQVSEDEKISSYTVKKIENEILHILRIKLKHFFKCC